MSRECRSGRSQNLTALSKKEKLLSWLPLAHELNPLCLRIRSALHSEGSISLEEAQARSMTRSFPLLSANLSIGGCITLSAVVPRPGPLARLLRRCISRFFVAPSTEGGVHPHRWCACPISRFVQLRGGLGCIGTSQDRGRRGGDGESA